MKNRNLQDYINLNRDLAMEKITAFFSELDTLDPETGFGITSVLRWKAEPVMQAEETLRELLQMEKFLEREVNQATPTSDRPMRSVEAVELAVLNESMQGWTREIMLGVGGSSTCPITNLASATREDALRGLVRNFDRLQQHLLDEEQKRVAGTAA